MSLKLAPVSGDGGATVALNVEIRDARLHHCGQMIRRLRHEHQRAFAMVGLNAHQELRRTVASSSEARSAFIDGRLAGMWGVVGTTLCPWGFVWLCMTEEAARHPVAALRLARREIDRFMRTRTELVTTVLSGDEAALRLCAWLGFHVEDTGLGASAVTRVGRRTLMDYAKRTPEIRVPAGRSYMIQMGYHPSYEEAYPCASQQ